MIKVQLKDLLNSTEALQKLSRQNLKARLAFQVARMLKAAEKEITDFNEVRTNLIKKYSEVDENGELIPDENGNIKISKENINVFNNEFNDLISSEIEIPTEPIKLDSLEDLTFTAAEMAVLEPFIEIE